MIEDRPAVLVDLPTSVRGFCFHDNDGELIIVLNSRLTREANKTTYSHEVGHIVRNEIDNISYIEYQGG